MNPSRDQRALVALGRFGRLSGAHLSHLICEARTEHAREIATWRVVRRLKDRGLIAPRPRLVGGPGGGSARTVYELSERGARYVSSFDQDLRGHGAVSRAASSVEHSLLAADIYVAFLRSARDHADHAISDWEPAPRLPELLGSARVIPDGHFVYSAAEWEIGVLIEADLGTERPARFARKISEYLGLLRRGSWRAHLGAWPLVLTVTPSVTRATELRRVTEAVLERQHDTERLARVAEFDFAAVADLDGPDAPLGAIWQVAGREGPHSLIGADAGDSPAEE